MEFLDKIVLHQSAYHMVLIKYLLVLTHFIFIGYTGLLLGSLLLSIILKNKYEKTNDIKYYLALKRIIDLATFNKGASFTFAIVPILSAMFGYSQLLHLSNLNNSIYLFWSALFLFIALLFIYSFKYSVHLKDIFNAAEKSFEPIENLKSEIEQYKDSTTLLYSKSSIYGLILLLISIYFYSVSFQGAIDFSKLSAGKSFIYEFLSFNTFTFYLLFINISFIITSIAILYKYFRKNTNENLQPEELKDFIKNISLNILLASSTIFPLIVVLNVFSKPVLSLSFNYFGALVVFFVLALFVISISYLMKKENNLNYIPSLLLIFTLTLFVFVVKEQFNFDTSTKSHFAFLSNEYDVYEKKLMESAGLLSVAINGADIYNGKCIACHQFDRKVVGPPYNSVLPKYEGKKDQLVKFILNPVKVNPEYPSMPNQGLKPKEAEAVADFLLKTYKKN